MKRISYADEHFVTDDRVADAVLLYATTLAIIGSADVISIPTVDANGTVRGVDLILGPASQVVAIEVDVPEADMHVEEVVEALHRRANAKLPSDSDVLDAHDLGSLLDHDSPSAPEDGH